MNDIDIFEAYHNDLRVRSAGKSQPTIPSRQRTLRKLHLPHRTPPHRLPQPLKPALMHLPPRQLIRELQPLGRAPRPLVHARIQHARDERIARAHRVHRVDGVLRLVGEGPPADGFVGHGAAVGELAHGGSAAWAPGADEEGGGLGVGDLGLEEGFGVGDGVA